MEVRKNMKQLLVIAAVSSLMVLTACSSFKKGSNNGEMMDSGGASSMGVGDSASFGGSDSDATRLMAPHNQTYHFEFDDSQILGEDRASMEAQARYLASHPAARILLTGHTDERGSREYNIALGERRAISVLDFLRMSGVKSGQIRTVSYGEEQPISQGHDESAYRQNRRVELIYEATE